VLCGLANKKPAPGHLLHERRIGQFAPGNRSFTIQSSLGTRPAHSDLPGHLSRDSNPGPPACEEATRSLWLSWFPVFAWLYTNSAHLLPRNAELIWLRHLDLSGRSTCEALLLACGSKSAIGFDLAKAFAPFSRVALVKQHVNPGCFVGFGGTSTSTYHPAPGAYVSILAQISARKSSLSPTSLISDSHYL
jgi:hypothetical protein